MNSIYIFRYSLARISDYIHYTSFYFFIFGKKRNMIIVTLGYFLSVNSWHNRHIFHYHWFRQLESLAKNAIEFFCRIARYFHMLFLVGSYGHYVRTIKQYVGSHKHWVIESPNTYFFIFSFGIFKSMRVHKVWHCSQSVKNPSKLSMFTDV